MFQASLLEPASAPAGFAPCRHARIFRENALRINQQPAGRLMGQTHMEGKDNEKMVSVDNTWSVERPAVGLRL
jgi:hypothetical protein